jgi:TRAP transporter TAXI family solute receptor
LPKKQARLDPDRFKFGNAGMKGGRAMGNIGKASKAKEASKMPLPVFAMVVLICIAGLLPAGAEAGGITVSIGGGPMGGTFRHFASAIAKYVSETYPDIDMISETSGGSLENVRRLHAGQFDFAIAYAGDIFLGAHGKLPRDDNLYDQVRPMSYLYGAPAQLVVRADSRTGQVAELAGKRVAVGNPGSGAALAAERFFKHLGLWGEIKTLYLGYATAAKAFNLGRIDAFWVLVGYPNSAVNTAAEKQKISLLPVGKAAEKGGFYDVYTFYTPVEIPAGTYPGVDTNCPTFQDSALLCTRLGIDDTVVYKVMQAVWSAEGLSHLGRAHKAARAMSVEKGLQGIAVPLAKGAAMFWEESNIKIPAAIRP